VRLLDAEYNSKLRNLGISESAEIKALQDKIDALNNATKAEDEALEDQAYLNDRANLVKSRDNAETAEDWEQYNEQIRELDESHQRTILLRERNNQINALQDEIEAIRDNYEKKREELQSWYDREKEVLDTALQDELDRIDDATKALELAYGIREADTKEHIATMQSIIDSLKDKIVTVSINYTTNGLPFSPYNPPYEPDRGEYTPEDIPEPPGWPDEMPWPPPGFAKGGIVNKPTLAMVGENGSEAIIPESDWGKMGGITINFTDTVFLDREDSINKLVDKLSNKLNRKQRFQFGKAYSG
jgi:hypothetical protein